MERIKSYFNNLITNSSLITIPIVTYLGYLFAYLYEVKSAEFYNIPRYLVQIELLQMTHIAVLIYFILFLIAYFIFQLAYTINKLLHFLHLVKRFYPEKEKKRLFNLNELFFYRRVLFFTNVINSK